MKALKRILLVLGIIIVVVLVVGFFLPRKVHVERSLVMKANPGLAYLQVDILKNWENWSPWHKLDPKMKLTYAGPTMGKGASYSWLSEVKEVGKGKLTIQGDHMYDTIIVAMEFSDNGVATLHFIFDKVDEGCKVTWTFDADMGMNPMHRYFGLFMDSMLGKFFATGLENMKAIVEANPNAIMKVEHMAHPYTSYLYIRDKMTQATIGEKMGEFYPEITKFIAAKGGVIAGAPFSISYTWEGKEWDVACGIPVTKEIPGEGRIQSGDMPACMTAYCDYYGPYEGTGLPHEIIHQWVSQNKKKVVLQPWESYLSDPMKEPNPQKWLTRVYYPVE